MLNNLSEFKDAIKQINLSDFTRIKIYNER